MGWITILGGILAGGAYAALSGSTGLVKVSVSLTLAAGGVVYGGLLRSFAAQIRMMARAAKLPARGEGEVLTPDEREELRRYRGELDAGGDGGRYWPKADDAGPDEPTARTGAQPLTTDEITALRAILRWNLAESSPTPSPKSSRDVPTD